ncbi:hypothetical protein [Pseudoduganella lutea]|uniref:DUF2946 domain-containing protein n=1 Tax=Pseudoduganella lutea TaxID=321985 RepID=A0A4P6L4F7_9BURK|nr:hypothetical protein [Pseudoduganella lutea]QBE66491.1 hypothetical protein EWM63_28900 [Pseudoduganella lutea]
MKALLLLILTFCLCTSAVAGQRVPHDCCPDQDQHCSLQCIDMGCAPGALAIAPPPVPVRWAVADANAERFVDHDDDLPSPYRTIWVPPD